MAATPPFFSQCGLERPRDFAAFREQVEGYCCEISAAASDALSGSRVHHPDTGVQDLKACLDAVATKFQIQFQLSQLAVDLAFEDTISASKAWRQIRAGCQVILRAVRPGLTFAALEKCVRDLEKLRPDSSRFLTFMRLSEAPPSAYDCLGCVRACRPPSRRFPRVAPARSKSRSLPGNGAARSTQSSKPPNRSSGAFMS